MLTAALGPAHPIPLDRLAELLSTAAARRFRLHPAKGEIAVGADADLVIVDIDAEREVTAESSCTSTRRIHRTWAGTCAGKFRARSFAARPS